MNAKKLDESKLYKVTFRTPEKRDELWLHIICSQVEDHPAMRMRGIKTPDGLPAFRQPTPEEVMEAYKDSRKIMFSTYHILHLLKAAEEGSAQTGHSLLYYESLMPGILDDLKIEEKGGRA